MWVLDSSFYQCVLSHRSNFQCQKIFSLLEQVSFGHAAEHFFLFVPSLFGMLAFVEDSLHLTIRRHCPPQVSFSVIFVGFSH